MEYVIIGLFSVMVSALVLANLLNFNRDRIIIHERLNTYTRREKKKRPIFLRNCRSVFKIRVVNRLISSLSGVFRRLIPNNEKESYDARLRTAGNPYGLNGDSYLVLKYAVLLYLLLSAV